MKDVTIDLMTLQILAWQYAPRPLDTFTRDEVAMAVLQATNFYALLHPLIRRGGSDEVHTRLIATRPSCMECERQLTIASFNKRVSARLMRSASLQSGEARA